MLRKTGGDAVREEQSAPGMPQYNQLQEDSWRRPEPIRVITAVPKAKEMETLALISALLLTVAGSGLFAGEGVEERYIFVNTTEFGIGSFVPGFSIEPREWSIILYCVAVFCFLCSTMIASIIMIILLIEVPEETVKYALGSLFHAPVLLRSRLHRPRRGDDLLLPLLDPDASDVRLPRVLQHLVHPADLHGDLARLPVAAGLVSNLSVFSAPTSPPPRRAARPPPPAAPRPASWPRCPCTRGHS